MDWVPSAAPRLWHIFGLGIRLSASAAATAHAAQKVQEEPSGFGSIISAYDLTVKSYGDMIWCDMMWYAPGQVAPMSWTWQKERQAVYFKKTPRGFNRFLLIQNGRNWRGFGFRVHHAMIQAACVLQDFASQPWSFQRYSWSAARAQAQRRFTSNWKCQPRIWDIASGNLLQSAIENGHW